MVAFSLAPRYRLDDEQPWLVGIDPLRRYWISVNGEDNLTLVIPGFQAESLAALREAIHTLRGMEAGDYAEFPTALDTPLTIHCIADNCFAVAGQVNASWVCHLFDQETLESLIMTAHPDWKCAPHHVDLGRQILVGAWQQAAIAKAA